MLCFQMKQRNLEDNLACKQKLIEVEKLKAELNDKNKLLAQTRNRGVATERRELSSKHEDLSAKMNKDHGLKKGIQYQIVELRKELGEKHLAEAEKEYVTRYVKKTVYEKAQKDVRRYRTALDNAIMQFHSKRMEMINELLWEYWSAIYKGNDIDCIQIRTENAGPKNVPGTGQKVKIDSRAKKSYNYRYLLALLLLITTP
jgi:DNA repair protein RAD50